MIFEYFLVLNSAIEYVIIVILGKVSDDITRRHKNKLTDFFSRFNLYNRLNLNLTIEIVYATQ